MLSPVMQQQPLLHLEAVLLVLLLLLCCRRCASLMRTIDVNEETPETEVLADVTSWFAEGTESVKMVKPSKLLKIEKIDGSLLLKLTQRLDREDVKLGCNQRESECRIGVTAIANPQDTVITFNLNVNDINDNSPVFKRNSVDIRIPECDTNATVPLLDLATDRDSDKFGVNANSYRIREGESLFYLSREKLQDNLHLRISKGAMLDHEQVTNYSLTLLVDDFGGKIGKQTLNILIADCNDNAPNISSIESVGTVLESLPIGSQVANVTAHDFDSGINGKLVFSFAQSDGTFAIDNRGVVTLNRTLDANKRSSYELKILVTDGGGKASGKINTVGARLTLNIKDTNDHKPQIEFEEIKKHNWTENQEPLTNFGFFKVTDGDKDEVNKKCDCMLLQGGRDFELDDMLLKSKRAFDYESTPSIVVEIQCTDRGQPPLSSTLVEIISIINVNEFRPVIKLPAQKFHYEVNETRSQSEIGNTVLLLEGSDRDANETLRFSISGPHSELFRVVTESSVNRMNITHASIRIKSRIDRESLFITGSTSSIEFDKSQNDLIRLVIVVTDSADRNGIQHSTSTTVTLKVNDINDNEPELIEPLLFEIKENCQRDTAADAKKNPESSHLQFSDSDIGVNAEATFRLLQVSAISAKDGRLSDLDESSWPLKVTADGRILCWGSIDREQLLKYALTVEVANSKAQPRLSSTGTVEVFIIDVNDNWPVWVFPHRSGDSVNISAVQAVGEGVTTVEADDADVMNNVTYSFVTPSKYFTIDAFKGTIRTKCTLTPGRHKLQIRATDNSEYRRSNDTILIINVHHHLAAQLHQELQLNLTIIVSMIIITAIISAGLVSAIICMRRKGPTAGPGEAAAVGFLADCDKDPPVGDCQQLDGQYLQLYPTVLKDAHLHQANEVGNAAVSTFKCNGGSNYLFHDNEDQDQLQLNGNNDNNANHSLTDHHHYQLSQQQQHYHHLHLHHQPHHHHHHHYQQQQQQQQQQLLSLQDFDRDSADSGRGGSEEDHSYQNNLYRTGGNATRRIQSPQHQLQQHQQQQQQHNLLHQKWAGIPEEQQQQQQQQQSTAEQCSFLPPPKSPYGVVTSYSNGCRIRDREFASSPC